MPVNPAARLRYHWLRARRNGIAIEPADSKGFGFQATSA